ncbi:hypothetical protein FACS1894187_16990 [Synergistales bacterium]|nr:hypothetical protein FACS1894187_16990 [Synergistales bacterium]
MRFRIFQMESVLSNINRGIKRSTAEELELKQNVSGLTSSLNIYDYCKEKLGMGSARHVERIQIPSSYASNIPSAPEKEWHSKILSALGLSLY